MITMPNWIMNNSHFESLFSVPLCKPLLDLQVCVVLMDDLRRKIISIQLHEAHHIIRTGGNQIRPKGNLQPELGFLEQIHQPIVETRD